MIYNRSTFQNMLIEHGLGDFNFKFDDNESYKAAYGEKDGIYCIININDNFERYSVNEFYFFKKNKNGNFDSVNYNGYCYFSYANKFYKKLKVVKEGKEEYIIYSNFDVFDNELNRNYLDITAFKDIYLDFERLTKLNPFYNAKHHVFKDDRPNKLKFEKGKIKSKSYINQSGHCDRKNGPAVITYDENGKLKEEFWYKNNITNKSRSKYKNIEGKFFCLRFDRSEEGFSSYNLYKLHKKNGYQYVTCDYYTDNKIVYRTYSKVPTFPSLTGTLHRNDDGPSVIDKCFGDINYNKRLVWYKDGFMHRGKDLPAEIYLDKTGFQVERLWYLDNKYHRENGPCHISYSRDKNGKLRLIQCFFCENGSYNRKKFPSYYSFTDGKITMKWYKNDMLHREDGPAYLVLDKKTMEPIKEEFYLRGNEIDEFKFEIMKASKKS